MYKVELFANYALMSLLPGDMKEAMCGKIEGTNRNTILTTFTERAERDSFLSICRRYGFQTQMIIGK